MWIFIITIIVGIVIILLAKKNQHNQTLSTSASENESFADNVLYTFETVGEQAYQENLRKIAGAKSEQSKFIEVMARVLSEPSNQFDKHAIKVEINGLTVGYLSKEDARQLAGKIIDTNVAAVINGGWLDEEDEGSYGVKLAIQSLDDLQGNSS